MSDARRSRLALWVTAAVLAAIPASRQLVAQSALESIQAQGQIFVLAGDRGNTAVQVGSDGPLVVDTQPGERSEEVLKAIRALTPRPIRHIVLTSGSRESAGGAAALSKAGRYVRVIDSIDPRGLDAKASIIAHLNVLNRMTAGNEPSDLWPTDTYFTSRWSLFSNGEGVELIHVPTGHSDGDTIVFFRRSDVVVTGAIFDSEGYPRFDPERGGSIDGVIDGLYTVLDLTIPSENFEDGTVVVPGHGRLADETDVANYRDMVVIVRDRVRDMVKKGMTLAQIIRAKPTADYDGVYGGNRDWPPDRFVEAVFRSVRGAGR